MPIMFGQVGNVPNSSIADATNAPFLQGKAGELVAAELHGKFYTANYRNRLYMANTLTAGTTIPIQATNLVSTFTLWNPLGSGVNVELARYIHQILAATTVVSDISLYLQSSVGGQNTAPGTLTALAIRPCNYGGGTIAPVAPSQVNFFSAATLVNTMATNMFRGPALAGFSAVTSTAAGAQIFDFDGQIIIPPGTLCTVCGNAAQTSASAQSLIWAEWPI